LSVYDQPSPEQQTHHEAHHEGNRHTPDLSALDAALREVIAAARIEAQQTAIHIQAPDQNHEPADVPEEDAGDLPGTLDVITRASKTIDLLIERNRALTDATVRSVDFLRKDAAEARAEAEALRAEAELLRDENEALKAAALAHAEELEAELAARTYELELTRAKMTELCAHVATLLGNVETRLGDDKTDALFNDR
jgi:hypothetical protein